MRSKLLAAAVLMLGVGVLFAGPAMAEGQPNFKSKVEEDCFNDHLAKGETVETCQKAPSPILPEKNELIWGTISFVVLLGLLWKFAWPGLSKGLNARTERIRGDLDAADTAKADAEAVLSDYKAQLADAKNESARIIEESRQQADALRRDQEQRLQTELAEMRSRAAADVESAKVQAIADLRGEVASLAIGAAEVVVRHSLDRDAQVQLIEDYINSVGAQGGS